MMKARVMEADWAGKQIQAACTCGWTGRTRNSNAVNYAKACEDAMKHAKKCAA